MVQDTTAEMGQDTLGDIETELDQGTSVEMVQNTLDDIEAELDQDTSVEMGQNTSVDGNACRKIMVPNDKRKAIVEALIARSRGGKLKPWDTRQVSIQFSVHIRTIQHIWDIGRSCMNEGVPVYVSTKKSKCGRMKKDVDVSVLKDLPLSSRTTSHDVAKHLHCCKGKVNKMKKRRCPDACLKHIEAPLARAEMDRLKWCMSMLEPTSIPHDPVFKGLFDFVIIDEKWFNITRKTERYYTVPGEELPTRTCRNKNYIPKIMILTALARPRFDSDGNCTFDGKIGCFPFVTYEPAKRSSLNRPAGTIELKAVGSIKKKEIQDFMIEKVLPSIRAKWLAEDAHMPIYIQQDNATPHITPTDRIFCEAAKEGGFDIRIVCQPADSPDFNVLDLGFFNSI